MGLLDQALASLQNNTTDENDVTTYPVVTEFIDGDTVRGSDGGPSYRLQGFDAPETTKFIADESGDLRLKAGTAGGQGAFRAIEDYARKLGYTFINDVGVEAAGGRRTGRLVNAEGDDFISRLYSSGAFRPTKYATEEDFNTYAVGQWLGTQEPKTELQQEFFNLAQEIQQAKDDDGFDPGLFKDVALNEQEYAANPGKYIEDIVKIRRGDRTIDNKAINPFSSSVGAAMESVIEAGYGMASYIGYVTGIEEFEQYGEDNVFRKQYEISQRPRLLLDYKDVDGFGSAVEFVTNNLGMSIPYMGITMASVMAAPVTYGTSLAVPAAIYTGQIWNEQDEKNRDAGLAIAGGIAQGALDVLGATKIMNLSSLTTPKEIIVAARDQLAKDKGLTKEAAEQQVLEFSKRQLAGLSKEVADVTKEQLRGKNNIARIAKNTAVSGAIEGATEATQEAIGYAAAHSKDDVFRYDEMADRMIAGAVAGASLGGAFGTAGGVWNKGSWEGALWAAEEADGSQISNDGQYAEEEAANSPTGRVPTNVENANEARKKSIDLGKNVRFNERADIGEAETRTPRTLGERFWEAAKSTPSLWRGQTRWIFTEDLKSKSRAMRKLSGMFGGTLQMIFPGPAFEGFKHLKVAEFEEAMGDPKQYYLKLGGGKRITRKLRRVESQKIYNVLKEAKGKDGRFDARKIPADLKNREVYVEIGDKAQVMADEMHRQQAVFNPKLGYIGNYLAKFKALNKEAVANNEAEFKVLLKKHYKMTDAEATKTVENILENPLKADIDGLFEGEEDTFSVTAGTPIPGSHRTRSLAMSENDAFDKFMETDFFANVNYAAKSAARYIAYQKFVGKNGSVIDQLLDEALEEGVAPSDVNRVAAKLRDYLNSESGNYKRAETDFGKTLQKVQKNFLTYSVVVGLPLATVSSMVELAITMKGLTNEQIFGKGGLKALGTEMGTMFYNGGGELFSALTRREYARKESKGTEIIRDLGFYEQEVGAATKTGVTEINQLKQGLLTEFFKWNGLQGWTQMTRAIRAAIAADYIFNHVETMYGHPTNTPMTKDVEAAREALRNIGLDPQVATSIYIKGNKGLTDSERMMMNNATFNFINEAIMMPTAANRPLIYQDPRFALFTQFQGFISTFTATFIPKLWGEYIKRGSPEMTYQAFSMMALMIVMGFASQELKDQLKYGESSPYLDDFEKARRAINSSGLLGTGERILNTIFPIYAQRTDGIAEWTWAEVSGQSPALTTLSNVASGVGSLLEGEGGRGANQLLKASPIVGSVTQARKAIARQVGGDE